MGKENFDISHNTSAQIVLSIAGILLFLFFMGGGFAAAFGTPKDFVEKNGAINTAKNQYILEKATQKAVKFVGISYGILVPFMLLLFWLVKNAIIFYPFLMLNSAFILGAIGLKEGYIDDFKKEYEKLNPNETSALKS
jgi:hypothetical protein